MLAVESTPSNSYKSISLQFILLIIIFIWKRQPQLKHGTTMSIKIYIKEISLVYSLPNKTAEINSLFVVMAAYFKLLCIKLSYTRCLMRCSQNAKQGRKSAYNVSERRIPICASWILWQMVMLFTPLCCNRRTGRPLKAQRLFSGFLKVYYVSCRCSGTVPFDDSAMLEWQPL